MFAILLPFQRALMWPSESPITGQNAFKLVVAKFSGFEKLNSLNGFKLKMDCIYGQRWLFKSRSILVVEQHIFPFVFYNMGHKILILFYCRNVLLWFYYFFLQITFSKEKHWAIWRDCWILSSGLRPSLHKNFAGTFPVLSGPWS